MNDILFLSIMLILTIVHAILFREDPLQNFLKREEWIPMSYPSKENQDITIDWEIAEDIVEFETQSSIPTSKDFYEIKTLKHNNGINYSLERHVVPIDQNYWWLHSSAHTDCGEFRVTYHGDPVIGEPVLLKQ